MTRSGRQRNGGFRMNEDQNPTFTLDRREWPRSWHFAGIALDTESRNLPADFRPEILGF